MKLYLPALVYVVCAVAYQVTAKTVPVGTNPFAMLTAVYIIAAAVCALLAILTRGEAALPALVRGIPKSALLMGIAVIGLEASMLYAYRMGWPVSLFPILVYSLLSVALLIVGAAAFSEGLTVKKLIGVGLCLSGLIVIRL